MIRAFLKEAVIDQCRAMVEYELARKNRRTTEESLSQYYFVHQTVTQIHMTVRTS